LESTLSFIGNNTFGSNSAKWCGGGISVDDSTLNFSGNTFFINNSAIQGGRIDASNN